MKKFMLSVIAVIFTIFGLVGCSSPANEEKPDANQSVQSEDNNSADDTAKEQNSTLENNNSDSDTDTGSPNDSDKSDKTEDSDSKQSEVTQTRVSRLYYYDIEKEEMFYIDESVDVIDGAYINALTKALKDNQDNEEFVTINQDTFVTSAKLDEETGILNIYFNDSFYLSTNLGSGIESGFIDALVNTYGYNYNVDKVAIYVEDKLYEDQRGTMPNGYFPVTAESATKYE